MIGVTALGTNMEGCKKTNMAVAGSCTFAFTGVVAPGSCCICFALLLVNNTSICRAAYGLLTSPQVWVAWCVLHWPLLTENHARPVHVLSSRAV